VIRLLSEIKGIGPSTVQGALLIALQRPDVINIDDLALRHASQMRYDLDHLHPQAKWPSSPDTGGPTGASPPAYC
jgi:3-methyladenine DNA glycosylase/8-oxoguanine DNA glycosylase